MALQQEYNQFQSENDKLDAKVASLEEELEVTNAKVIIFKYTLNGLNFARD